LLVNLAVFLVAILVAAGLAEMLVRIIAPQQLIQIRPDIWRPADSLGWTNRPNVNTTINTGERTVHLYTDSAGLRVGAGGRQAAPTKVLVIGDSFMEALQVEYEQTFSGLLGPGLTGRLGHGVEVFDAGVDGWDPPQYLVRARQLMATDHYDLLVVAVYLGNDVIARRVDDIPPRAPQVLHHLRVPRSLRWSEMVDALLYPLNDVLKRHSQLFIFFKNRLQSLRQRAHLTADFFPVELRRSEATAPRWALTADVCAEIVAMARQHGVPTLTVLIPSPIAVDTATFSVYAKGFKIDPGTVDLGQPTRRMKEELDARHVVNLAVQQNFMTAESVGEKLYGSVDRHLTIAGNRLLEKLVEPMAAALIGTSAAPLKRSPHHGGG
jgi:hypothetical protein